MRATARIVYYNSPYKSRMVFPFRSPKAVSAPALLLVVPSFFLLSFAEPVVAEGRDMRDPAAQFMQDEQRGRFDDIIARQDAALDAERRDLV